MDNIPIHKQLYWNPVTKKVQTDSIYFTDGKMRKAQPVSVRKSTIIDTAYIGLTSSASVRK